MRVVWTAKEANVQITFDAGTVKEAWEIVAILEETWDEVACGCCGNMALTHEVREFDANKFYKLSCDTCNAQLDYGQSKDNKSIYPKRYHPETKQSLPNRGWYIYQPAPPPPPPPTAKPKRQKTIAEGATNAT